MAGGTYSAQRIAALLSESRFRPYLDQTDQDIVKALELYEWAWEMQAAAFQSVAGLEVFLRNAIDEAMAEYFRERQRRIPWFLLRPPMDDATSKSVETVRNRLANRQSRDQIVAGMDFGFWTGWLGGKHEELWRAALAGAFPHATKGLRKNISLPVEQIRKFRNRLAHHDSVLNLDVPFELQRVYEVAGFIHPDARNWIEAGDKSMEVYAQKPHSRLDTVIVPGKDAWPLYQTQFAYVCQPGRFFRPVQRISFYADGEVKPDFPKIQERRDNLDWSSANESRLLASANRTDRRIGRLIGPARLAGWSGGRYQVFLLTRPGDPGHRSRSTAIPHRANGRGSAFVRRQRYTSLHSLETAVDTSEI